MCNICPIEKCSHMLSWFYNYIFLVLIHQLFKNIFKQIILMLPNSSTLYFVDVECNKDAFLIDYYFDRLCHTRKLKKCKPQNCAQDMNIFVVKLLKLVRNSILNLYFTYYYIFKYSDCDIVKLFLWQSSIKGYTYLLTFFTSSVIALRIAIVGLLQLKLLPLLELLLLHRLLLLF